MILQQTILMLVNQDLWVSLGSTTFLLATKIVIPQKQGTVTWAVAQVLAFSSNLHSVTPAETKMRTNIKTRCMYSMSNSLTNLLVEPPFCSVTY